jgi:Uma2 family endonuclease
MAKFDVMSFLAELPSIKNQTVFNLGRWDEICADPELRKHQGRIETDRFGGLIMCFPAEYSHGGWQGDIVTALNNLMIEGRATVETPVSTTEGIKVADVAWASKKRLLKIGGRKALSAAPEICVEVISPSNTRNEIDEKKRLYFEAGAKEVWICDRQGNLRFYSRTKPKTAALTSALCPKMPNTLG